MRRAALWAIAALTLTLGVGGHARAQQVPIEFGSSPNPVGSGARALGVGSAFIATADDATAASWNPAGLIALEAPELSLVGSFKNRNEYFGGVGIAPGEEVQRYTYPGLNYFSAAYPFKVGSRFFVAALNFQALIDFDKKVDKSYFLSATTGANLVAQTDVEFEQRGSMRALTPALAFQLSPYLSLGAALTLWTDKLGWGNGWSQREKVLRTVMLNANSTTAEIAIRERYDHNGIGANVGVLWDATPRLTVGAVVKTPVWGTLTRTIEQYQVTGGPTLATPVEYEESFRMPPSYGAGAAYRFSDELTVSADVYRIEWGFFRQSKTDPATGDTRAINPINAQPYRKAGVPGVTQAHLGAERLFVFPRTVVPLRGGLFYDPQPGNRRTHHFLGLAAGTGVSVGDLILDVAYQFRFATGGEPDVVSLGDPSGGVTTTSSEGGVIWQHLLYVSAIQHF